MIALFICNMKLKTIPTNKLALLCAAFCAAMLAFSHNANALRVPMPSSPTTTLGFFPDPHVGTTIDLNAIGGTFTYLFAKYDGQNDVSQVWNISGLTGVITIPADGPNGYGLSGWILFGPTGQVPDGGTTVMLLGAALGVLGMARRYIMS